MSLVRENLLNRLGYVPYCGRDTCFSRAQFDGEQFKCRCGWRSAFEPEFIEQYKAAQAKLATPASAAPSQDSLQRAGDEGAVCACGPMCRDEGGPTCRYIRAKEQQ
jgi:hypothetical protein